MPQLHGSGDIFRAAAGAGFDEGIVRGKVGGQGRLTFDGDFVLCHGLNAQLNARAAAAIDLELTALFLLAGQAHGEAFASAGAGVDARLSVDLFDSFGFSASAAAFAEASVAGRLSVALDLRALAALAQMQLNNVAYDIFVAFLNEVSIGAGVWGQLSAAAMAKAHVNVHGSLKDDSDAGFVIEAGAAAGCGAGAGFDFYAGLKLDNPKRFYLYAVERITREVVSGARAIAPPEVKPAIPLLELALPTVLNASYELAQKSVISSLSSPDLMASSFVRTFTAQLQRFLLDKLAECGAELLRKWLDDVLHDASGAIVPQQLDSAQRAALNSTLDSALEEMRVGALDWETFERVLPKLHDCLTSLFPDQVEEWRVPVTALWTALTAVNAVRTGVGAKFGYASISLAGVLDERGEGIILPLPDPPTSVREELETFFGGSPDRFTFTDATAYLLGSGVASTLPSALPELQTALGLLERHTGITYGNLIAGGLQGTLTGDVAHTEMYQKLRAFFEEALDGYVLADLLPALRRTLGPTDDARIWIDEVAEPSLQMASSFVFDRLDEFVNGTISGSALSPAFNSFRTALSHLVGKIVTRNVVVVSDILLAHAIESLEQGFLDLESTIRRDPNGVARTAAQVAIALLPPLAPVPSNMAEASQELFADLANAGAAALGPRVFSRQRRELMRDLMIRLLDSIDGDVDYTDGDDVDNFFKQLFECAYVPDPDALIALLELQVATLNDEFNVLFPRVTLALEIFYLSLTKSVVDDMSDGAIAIVKAVADAVEAAWEEFRKWQEEYGKWEREATAFAREVASHLDVAADILKSSARRSEIISKLRTDGIAAAEAFARSVWGFDGLSRDDQNSAIGAAVGTFTAIFDTAKPLINAALRTLGDVADNLEDLVDDAADLPELRDNLGAMIRDEIISAVGDATGLVLPAEIGPSDIGRVAAALIRGIETLRDELNAALNARIDRDEAEQEKLAAQSSRDRAQEKVSGERERQAELVGEPVRINVVAPLPPTGAHPPVYPGAVQLVLLIEGARPSYVESAATKRVLVALNGQPVTAGSSEWQYDPDSKTLSLSLMLTAGRHGLRPGLNVIECSVTDGANEIARSTAPFAVNMALPFTGNIQFDYDQSVIDVEGDDHYRTSRECVALNNLSLQPASLRDWSVRDAIGHRYVFGDITVPSGGRLRLHTGPGVDETASSQIVLFQGKNRAIWNNTGDTALLVDPSGINRATLIYLPGRSLS